MSEGTRAEESAIEWPPAQAVAATLAILLVSAGVASAIAAVLLPGGLQGGGERVETSPVAAGLVWLLAFQACVVIQTLLAARAHCGAPLRVLALERSTFEPRLIAWALPALCAFAALYAAMVHLVDPAALVRDLTPAAGIARSDHWLLALVVIGVGAPLAEELLFRGFLFPAIARSRIGLRGAAVLSTLAWTALHAGYSIFGLVEVFLVGLFFCWLLIRSGSLWVPIACHAIYNSIIVVGLRWLPIPL